MEASTAQFFFRITCPECGDEHRAHWIAGASTTPRPYPGPSLTHPVVGVQGAPSSGRCGALKRPFAALTPPRAGSAPTDRAGVSGGRDWMGRNTVLGSHALIRTGSGVLEPAPLGDPPDPRDGLLRAGGRVRVTTHSTTYPHVLPPGSGGAYVCRSQQATIRSKGRSAATVPKYVWTVTMFVAVTDAMAELFG